MEFTAQKIADFLNGKIEGDATVKVSNISKIEEGKIGTLSFLANPKYNEYIYTTKASVVLVNKSFISEKEIKPCLIRVDDAYTAFASLLELYNSFQGNEKPVISVNSAIHTTAILGDNLFIDNFVSIGKNVEIGNNVKIYANSVIRNNTRIGENTTIYSGVNLYNNCEIGRNCIIHSGAIIGSDGFGFAPQKNAAFKKIPQLGNVIVEDNVEIGANTAIDRATIGSTIIRTGVKLDNFIQIAHNVEIGENTVIAAQTGIAGSTKIGKNCMIGGQVAIAGHLTIANNTKLGAKAGVAQSIKEENKTLIGVPAIDLKSFFRSSAIFKRLPEMRRELNKLSKKIEESIK